MPSDHSSNYQIGQSVGANLRAARLAKKLTQSQLANPDFSVSYISAIERGQIHPSLRALEILARRLGLSSAQLLPGQNAAKETSSTHIPLKSEEEVELELLEARIAIRQGTVQQAIAQLPGITSKDLKLRQQIQLHYLLGWAYAQSGQLQEGESVLSEALQLAGNHDDYMSAQILNALGTVYTSMHNYTQGLQTYQSCLELLEKQEEQQPNDPFFLAQIYTNMGQIYIFLNKFELAIEMFQRALAVTEELNTPPNLQSTYWNMFQHHAASDGSPEATLYIYKYSQLQNQLSSQLLRSEIYYYLGRAMLKGDRQKAYEYLEHALQEESVLADPLTLACVTAQMGEWFLEQNKVKEAEECAEKADSLTQLSSDSIIRAETLLLCGGSAYAQKHYEIGDVNFVTALKMLERLGQREEFSSQSAHYAQLLEERGATGEALVYFKQAFESQDKMARYPYE